MISLKQYITSFNTITNNQKSIAYLTDLSQNIIAISKSFETEFKLENPNEVLGFNYQNLKATSLNFFKNYANILKTDDEFVIQTNSHHVYLHIMVDGHNNRLYIVHKYPIIIGHQVKGVYTYMHPYSFPRIPDISFLTYGLSNLYSKPLTDHYKLTPKQFLVLFFLIRDYSYTSISSWLSAYGHSMSVARVNEHIINLKKIFLVSTREELVDKALQSGYYSNMPAGLFNSGSFLIDNYLFKLNVITSINDTNCIPEFISPTLSYDNYIIYNTKHEILHQDLINYIHHSINLYQFIDRAICFLDSNYKTVATTSKFDELGITDITSFINKTTNSTKFLHITPNKQIFIIYNHPILDKQNSIIGNHIEIYPYVMPSIPKITEEIFTRAALPNINKKNINLTPKEIHILYFYIRNFWTQKISNTLTQMGQSILPNTVNKHLNNMKKKFNLKQKEQLIDYAIISCYHIIPSELIQSGTYNLENTIIDSWRS